MTIHEETLSEAMVSNINDFIDFILLKKDHKKQEILLFLSESINLLKLDFSDYLANLESYEDSCLRGKIQKC
jgi:hypothetical protein